MMMASQHTIRVLLADSGVTFKISLDPSELTYVV